MALNLSIATVRVRGGGGIQTQGILTPECTPFALLGAGPQVTAGLAAQLGPQQGEGGSWLAAVSFCQAQSPGRVCPVPEPLGSLCPWAGGDKYCVYTSWQE